MEGLVILQGKKGVLDLWSQLQKAEGLRYPSLGDAQLAGDVGPGLDLGVVLQEGLIAAGLGKRGDVGLPLGLRRGSDPKVIMLPTVAWQ